MNMELTIIRAVVLGAALSLALYLSGLLVMFTPLPLLYVGLTQRRRWAVFTACLGVAIMVLLQASTFPLPGHGLLIGFPRTAVQFFSIVYYLFFAVIGLMLNEGMRRHWTMNQRWSRALAAGLVLGVSALLLVAKVGKVPLIAGIKSYIAATVEEVVRLKGLADGPSGSLLAEHTADIAAFAFDILPGVVFAFLLAAVVVNSLLGRRLAGIFPGRWDPSESLTAFRLPDVIVWLPIASGIAFFAGTYRVGMSTVKLIALNLLVVAGALYFFQGLAVVVSLVRSLRVPMIRGFAYAALIVFFQAAAFFIVGLGVADVWVDFRHRLMRSKEERT